MDPITLIVSALINGLLAGVSSAAEDSVKAGYGSLKRALLAKFASPQHPALKIAIDQLERDPGSAKAVAAVEQELRNVGADQDPEVRLLASTLAGILDDPMQHLANDPVELASRQAGLQAVGQVMERHMNTVMMARSAHSVDDTDLLTSRIASTRVPQAVRDEIMSLHGDVRDIIEQIAARIESGKYRDAELAIQSMPLAHNERERARRLVEADQRVHVSYQTLRITVELFGGLNKTVLSNIERETSRQREANMMLGNAILIYELTDFVINYVEAFAVTGDADIASLHQETVAKISELRNQHDLLERQASAADVEPAVRAQTLDDIRNRRGAIDVLEQEWSSYVAEIEKVHEAVGEVRSKLATLELIRENARVQISVIQLVAMLKFLKQNSDAIQGTIEALKGFRLAPLTSNRVRRLLGVG